MAATERTESSASDGRRRLTRRLGSYRHGSSGRTRSYASAKFGRLAMLVAVAVVALGPWLAVGNVSAGPPAGAPTLPNYVIVGGGAALVAIGYVGFGDIWTAAFNGSQVFSSAFYLVFFNLRPVPALVTITVWQADGYWDNTSVTVYPISSVGITLPLAVNTAWVHTTLAFDNVSGWSGQVATPVSLLPDYIINVGGLDLFALTLVSFMLIVGSAGVVTARWAVRRAGGYAPHFSILFWGHLLLGGIVSIVILDYQFIDATFAGFSPLFYPWLTFPFGFLWALSFFNRARRIEGLRGERGASGEFGFVRKLVRVALVEDRLAFMGAGWGQFWARFWGHFNYVDEVEPPRRPWLIPVRNERSPTDLRPLLRRRKVAPISSVEALTKFPVLSEVEKDGVEFIVWLQDGPLPKIPWYHLVMHRTVTVEKILKNADGSERVEKLTRRRLSLPHYEGGGAAQPFPFHDIHMQPTGVAWAYYRSLWDLGRVLRRFKSAYESLEAHIESIVEDREYEALKSKYAVIDHATSGLSEEESARLAARLTDVVQRARERKEPTA